MDAARYRRLKDLAHAALDVPAEQRRAWLEARAEGDEALVARALALLSEAAPRTFDLLGVALEPSPSPAAPLIPPGTLLGRYRTGAEIGRGGMGVVVEAEEVASLRPVAIKVILPHLLDSAAARERFLREARLGLLIEHENVVRALDLGQAQVGGKTLLYLVMERVHGRTLRRVLEEMGSLPEPLLREIALQCAAGLAALHAAGVVHRDLKPENLLLTDDRRVRIMDLGVARVAESVRTLTLEGHFVGSPAYASPEQCRGEAVGPPADLYALGAVLYELAGGHPLFDARDPLALLRAQVDLEPRPVRERSPELSEFSAGLIHALLEKDAARRLPSAGALVRALSEGESGEWWEQRRRASRGVPSTARLAPRLQRTVGRDAERRALREAWRAARDGAGSVVLLEGEAGIGKSHLVHDVVDAVVAEGRATVLRSGFVPAGEAVGLGQALVAHLRGSLEEDVRRRLDVPQPLAAAFAAWLRNAGVPDGAQALAPGAPEALLARFARSLSESQPLLWVVEDLHFADALARRALVALARAAVGRALLVLVTTRPGAPAEVLSALSSSPAFRALELRRLETSEVADLVADALGDAALARRLARTLAPRADGVPYFVLELLRDWERRGHLVREPGGALREGAALDPLEAPRALRDLVRARLESLSPTERAVLDACAVAGFEFDPGLVARARGSARIEVLETLGRLERVHGLVRAAGSRLCRLDHHVLQEVLYAELPAPLRAELHDAMAEAVAAASADDPTPADVRLRVAHHRLRGGRPAAARQAVLDLARGPALRTRDAERVALFAAALGEPGLLAGTERIDLLLEAGKQGLALGRSDAAALLSEAHDLALAAGDMPRLARAELQRGFERLRVADYEAARALGASAAERFQAVGDVRARVNAMGVEGKAYWCLGRHAEARACHERALAIATLASQDVAAARAAADLAIVLQEMGLLEEAEAHQRRAAQVLEATNDRYNTDAVLTDLGNTLSAMGRLAEARPVYEQVLASAQREGLPDQESVVWVNVAELELRSGELDASRRALLRALALAQETGARRVEGYALHGLGLTAHWAGDLVEARLRFEQALALRRSIDNRPALAETLLRLGALAGEAGATPESRGFLAEARTLAESVNDPSGAVLARCYETLHGVGDLGMARQAFALAAPRMRLDARLEARWLLWRARGEPDDLQHARALLEEQQRHVLPSSAAAFLEHVPYARELASAAAPPQ